MPDLKIHFEYLCAFVPPDLFAKLPKSCWVVLPDFRKAAKAHFPVLLYDRNDRNSDTEVTNAGLIPKEAGTPSKKKLDTWDKLDLDGEELEIWPDGKPLTGESLVTASNLDAALRIFYADVKLEVFKGDLLKGDSSKVIACRLFLRKGTLGVGLETPEAFGVYNLKKDVPLLHRQKMAQQVVASISFVNFVDLIFRKMSTGGEMRLRLKANTSPQVDVTVRNCEAGVVWDRKLPPYDKQFHDEINQFFELSRDYDPKAPPPEILLKLSEDSPGGICAPKTFDGWG